MEVIDFELQSSEKWITINAADGTELRVKLSIMEVLKLRGEYRLDGEPIYTVNTQLLVTSKAPESLLKQPEVIVGKVQ